LERLLRATINTWKGLVSATRTEAAFREEIALLLIAIPTALYVTPDYWKRVALVGIIFFTLIVEILNTAIEKLADRVTLEHDPKIGVVKDLGSAAVGLSLVAIFFVWLLVLSE
jgi:diacylglycerol kinase (ATP)